MGEYISRRVVNVEELVCGRQTTCSYGLERSYRLMMGLVSVLIFELDHLDTDPNINGRLW